MALYLCLNEDGTGVVSEQNPIQTKHTTNGEPATLPVYVFNDGKRKGVANDTNPPKLIYTNVQIKVEGVGYRLETGLISSTSDVIVNLESNEGWNIGTIIKSGLERMRVEEILTPTSVRVQRNYSADGVSSTISSHNIGAMFISETTSVSLALPNVNDYNQEGTYLGGGQALTGGLDPTLLTNALDAQETSNIVRSSRADRYAVGSLLKLNNETMKVLSISGSELTVLRGYNGTKRQAHGTNTVITCVGITDIGVTHKLYVKNDPPAGLPTQKKRDVKIVIIGDEEPL